MAKAKYKITKNTLVVVTLIAIVILNIYFMFIRPESSIEDSDRLEQANKSSQTEKKSIDQKMKGIHLVENNQDQKGWELKAEEALGTSAEAWSLNKINVVFFSENGSSFSVKGDFGKVDGQTKNMIIQGHVVTESSNGYSFFTDELKYDAQTKKLFTENAVNMKGPSDSKGSGFELTGTGFQIHIPTQKMRILKQVSGTKMVDGKRFSINSESAEFTTQAMEGLFSGNTILKYDKMLTTAPFTEFKYSKNKKSIERIILYDKVILTDDNKNAECKELIIEFLKDEMILKGNPFVKMGEDEIQGEEIIFYEKGKKIKIKQMNLQRSMKGNNL